MIVAIDFDGTIVQQNRPYDDVHSPLEWVPGAQAGLYSLKKADHTLILYSARANLALRQDWRLNPLWRDGIVPINVKAWERNQPLHEARYQQMVRFVAVKLPRMFAAIDDGHQGKVLASIFIDDKAFGSATYANAGVDWKAVTRHFGEE